MGATELKRVPTILPKDAPAVKGKFSQRRRLHGLSILHEDDAVIVVVKDAGLLTEATRKHDSFTAENALNLYLRKGQARSRRHVWLVHRLDRDTSGVMVFAKTEEACEFLKERWHEAVVKKYLAVTAVVPSPPAGVLRGWLREDRDLFVRQLPFAAVHGEREARAQGLKYAETEYETLRCKNGRALVLATLHTGRRNQIRVQFADAGWPILGDTKYGDRRGKGTGARRLMLHALSISFPHPATGERMEFRAPPPGEFGMSSDP